MSHCWFMRRLGMWNQTRTCFSLLQDYILKRFWVFYNVLSYFYLGGSGQSSLLTVWIKMYPRSKYKITGVWRGDGAEDLYIDKVLGSDPQEAAGTQQQAGRLHARTEGEEAQQCRSSGLENLAAQLLGAGKSKQYKWLGQDGADTRPACTGEGEESNSRSKAGWRWADHPQ